MGLKLIIVALALFFVTMLLGMAVDNYNTKQVLAECYRKAQPGVDCSLLTLSPEQLFILKAKELESKK